ncbi:MAG: InlB B-repeat-containing protein, partial [Candidatus Rokuibacteriota bacterium]
MLALLLTAASAAVAAPYAYISNFVPGTVSVIDAGSTALCLNPVHTPPCVVKVLSVGALPGGVAVNPAGTFAYVANKDDGTLSVINVATNTVMTTVPVGSEPWGVAVNADGSKVYVSLNGAVAVVDAASLNVTPISLSGVLNGLVVVGTRLYVADATAGEVVMIDTNNPTPPFTRIPVGTAFNSMPMGLVANATGTRVYVADLIADFVSVLEVSAINTATNAVEPTETVSIDLDSTAGPGGVALSPDGTLLYATNDSLNRVTIVTLANKSMQHVTVGVTPIGVATDPAGRAYVVNAGSASVSIIDPATTAVCSVANQVPPCVVKTVPSGPMSFVFGAFVTAGPPAPAQFVLGLSTNGGGSGSIAASPMPVNGTYTAGTVVSLTATPATSSDFSGWSGACSGSGACSVTMDAAKNVTATFTLKQHALSLSTNGNGSGSVTPNTPPLNGTYGHGIVVSLTATPAADSQFSGWAGACTGSGACSVTMDAAKSVTATFTLKEYGLSVSTNGTGSGSVAANPTPVNGTYAHGTLVAVTATPAASSQFTGWSGACTGSGGCSVTMDAAKSVTATFTLKQYSLSVSMNGTGSGSVTANPPGGTYNHGAVVSLTATPAVSSQFGAWSGACSGSGACSVTMDGAKSVTATFTLKQYGLAMLTVGNGSITANPAGGTYTHGTFVALTATPAAGFQFTSWSGACSGLGTCNVLMDAAKSVTATFTTLAPAQFTLTLDTVGSGSVSAQPPAIAGGVSSLAARPLAILGKYNAGTVVAVTATSAPGFKFTGWSGGCTGTAACSVTMDADKSVTANFTAASEPPTTCDAKIKDWQKKVADHKHPWWHNYKLRISLKMYAEALDELGRAKAKVGTRDKRYLHAEKEFNDGKSALC